MRRVRRYLLLLLTLSMALAALSGSACTSSAGGVKPTAGPSPQLPVSGAIEQGASEAGFEWQQLFELPAEAYDVQASYQFQYGGPDGGATPKIILRLEDESRFSIAASEFGKRIFTLEVVDERALFLDHRAKTHCWLVGEIELDALPLGALSSRALPALLFDRLPVAAVGGVESHDGEISFDDESGRRWLVKPEKPQPGAQAGVLGWTVLYGERPEVWLSRQGSTRYLSARDLQLRWRRGHSETLAQPLARPIPPADYDEECTAFDRQP